MRREFADPGVHARDHRRLPFLHIGPRLVRIVTVGRHFLAVAQLVRTLVVGVRHNQREIEKERLLLVALDESPRFFEKRSPA